MDGGTVTTKLSVSNMPVTNTIDFKTYFRRPDKFRFEWQMWHPYFGKAKPSSFNIICSDGKKIISYIGFQKQLSTHKSLSSAIQSTSGVALGAPLHAVTLLLPNIGISGISDLKGLRYLVTDDKIDEKESCHLIGGSTKTLDTEFWLRKDILTLSSVRQYLEVTPQDTDRLKDITEKGLNQNSGNWNDHGSYTQCNYYDIQFDSPLSEEFFSYSPPLESL